MWGTGKKHGAWGKIGMVSCLRSSVGDTQDVRVVRDLQNLGCKRAGSGGATVRIGRAGNGKEAV